MASVFYQQNSVSWANRQLNVSLNGNLLKHDNHTELQLVLFTISLLPRCVDTPLSLGTASTTDYPSVSVESCSSVADVISRPLARQHLRSASQWKMIVPRYRIYSYGRRCFAVAGPSTWNSLPYSLRDPALSLSIFRSHLKTHFLRNIDETYSAH